MHVRALHTRFVWTDLIACSTCGGFEEPDRRLSFVPPCGGFEELDRKASGNDYV